MAPFLENPALLALAGLIVLQGIYFAFRLLGSTKARIARLAKKGNPLEAAEMALGAGQHATAIDLFLRAGKPARAAHVAMQIGRSQRAAELFEQAGDSRRAAQCFEQAGMNEEAERLRQGSSSLPSSVPTDRQSAPPARTSAVPAPRQSAPPPARPSSPPPARHQARPSAPPQPPQSAPAAAASPPPPVRQSAPSTHTSTDSSPPPPSARAPGARPEATAAARPVRGPGEPPSAACVAALKKVTDLQSIPGLASRMIQTLDDPNASANQVGQEITRDQGLTATVLRAANSPYYRATGQVRDITEALVVVGYESVRQLVLGRLSRSTLRKNDALQQALWRHALATGLGSQACARIIKGVTVGHAFTGGLLHDIGKAVLHEAHGHDYANVWSEAGSGRPADEIEFERYQTDHAEVGGEVCRIWQLPPFYVKICRYHPNPATAPELNDKERRLLWIVALAGAFATWIGHGPAPARPASDFDARPWLGALGASPDVVAKMNEHVAKELGALEGIFG